MRVLLVEKNARLASALSACLGAEGLRVEHAETSNDALHLLQLYEFDLALLGTPTPDTDALPLLGRIRLAKHHTPVVVFSATPQTRLRALAIGADDVVERDIDRDELVARIRAIVRRSRGFSQSLLQVGQLTLDLVHHDVVAQNTRVSFTPREFDILQLLVLRRNMILTKEAILSHLYGGRDEPEIKIIDVFICKIRSKLTRAGLPYLISTVWGRGYTVKDDGKERTSTMPPSAMPAPATTRATTRKQEVYA